MRTQPRPSSAWSVAAASRSTEDRDDQRKVRERVTGKLLALDRTLELTLPAFLSLLDAPIEDGQWQALDPPQRRQQTLDAVKRLFLRESRIQPVIVIFEDLHWIDLETQALLDSLVDSLPTARMLLLVNYRPEYEHRWVGKSYYTQLRLDPLPPESAGSCSTPCSALTCASSRLRTCSSRARSETRSSWRRASARWPRQESWTASAGATGW
jgi:hypothetical protein